MCVNLFLLSVRRWRYPKVFLWVWISCSVGLRPGVFSRGGAKGRRPKALSATRAVLVQFLSCFLMHDGSGGQGFLYWGLKREHLKRV
ncbi:hypothetical protein B0J12DRAFT_263933 [Macrophomina phaseolina]|uniref:Secreted protein n=1 Tax=Macrophomina phaseolina TaxID=35725 RepID=A0ABQ8FZA1_9PEZI|nr:hypothetical protein B0J12DRAFT_263933 [Macrophomina phaseolina]